MNQTGLVDIFAGVALIAGDIIAGFGLVGSMLVLITGIVSFVSKKFIRFGDQELQWSIAGLFFGAALQVCVYFSKQKIPLEGFLIRMPPQTVNLILILSFCLLFLGFMIRRAAKKQPGYIALPVKKRASNRRNLASGYEFNSADGTQKLDNPRQRRKAVTIPRDDIEKEVAWVFSTLYPVKAKVDNPPKGKINIKLFDANDKLVGVVQVSQDPEDSFLPPSALGTLNSYRSKSQIEKAFFVTTGMFRDDTSSQAKDMGISLVDGPLLDAWRKRARAKSGASNSN